MNVEPAIDKTNDLEKSIIETRNILIESLNGCDLTDVQSFISHRKLARPPFSFIQTLLKLYMKSFSFAEGLYTDEELDPKAMINRQDKIRFLVKILSCVAFITEERIDLYICPAHVITGMNITTTHSFLRLLARAVDAPPDVTRVEASKVLEIGESVLHRQAVKVRSTIVTFQSYFRQKQVKKQFLLPSITNVEHERYDCPTCPVSAALESEPLIEASIETTLTDSPSGKSTDRKDQQEKLASTSANRASKQTVAHKGKIDSPTRMPKLKRLKVNSPKTSVVQKQIKTNCISSESKKISVQHGVVQETVMGPNLNKNMETFKGQSTITLSMRSSQEDNESREKIKRQLTRLQKRQELISRMTEDLKTKEHEIEIRERRLIHLSDCIKRQQMKLEKDRCAKMEEFDEVKLKLFEDNFRRRNEFHDSSSRSSLAASSKEKIKDMIAHNPSLTDLRLMLEKKTDSISKREKRIIQIEKELRRENNIVMMQLESCCTTPMRTRRIHPGG